MMLRVCDRCGDQNSQTCQLAELRMNDRERFRTWIGWDKPASQGALDLCFRCKEELTREDEILDSLKAGNREPLSRWLLNVPLPEYDDLENAVQRMWKDKEKEPLYTSCGHTYGCTCPACTGKLIDVGRI